MMELEPLILVILGLVREHGEDMADRISRVLFRKTEKRVELWVKDLGDTDRPLNSSCNDFESLRAGLESNGEDFVRRLAEALFRRMGRGAVLGYSPSPDIVVWLRK